MKLTKILLEYPGAFTPAPDDEIEKNREDFMERLDPAILIKRYIEGGFKGDLELGMTNIENDEILFADKKFATLPDELTLVDGMLTIYNFEELIALPDRLVVNDDLLMFNCPKFITLPSKLTVKSSVEIEYCNSFVLPEKTNIEGHGLFVANCSGLVSLPSSIDYGSCSTVSIYDCNNLSRVPASLFTKQGLDLSHCQGLKTLPKKLIAKSLEVSNCQNLTRLPDYFRLEDKLVIDNCPNISYIGTGQMSSGHPLGQQDLIIKGECKLLDIYSEEELHQKIKGLRRIIRK